MRSSRLSFVARQVFSLLFFFLFQLVFSASPLPGLRLSTRKTGKQAKRHRSLSPSPRLQPLHRPFFSILKPAQWTLRTAGACDTFALLLRSSKEPLLQVFYFNAVGPLYMSPQQKAIDAAYMRQGGYPVPWFSMPAIAPFTPSQFLKSFSAISRTPLAQQFMPHLPSLAELHLISEKTLPTPLAPIGARAALLRALFAEKKERKKIGEGFFSVTLAPFAPFTGGPGGGTGYALMFAGVTAPKKELSHQLPLLTRILKSLTFNKQAVASCIAQQKAAFQGVLRAGKTLSETSELIVKGWEGRSRIEDILSEKRSDAILGKERLYDPNSGRVYQFDLGFYEKYQLNPQRYKLSELRPLPKESYSLWMKPPLDGYRYLK